MESNLTNSILDAMVINTYNFGARDSAENANKKKKHTQRRKEKNRELIKAS